MSDFALPSVRDWDHPTLDLYAATSLLHRDAALPDVVRRCMGGLAYLATPYTGLCRCDCGAWQERASLRAGVDAARWAAVLGWHGVTAISPIVQAVQMVDCGARTLDPLDAAFWERWCRPLLAASDVVIVPPIRGWRVSDGIWHELRSALLGSRRVYLIRPGQLRAGNVPVSALDGACHETG